MTAKYRKGFVQRDSVEREEYAKAPSASPGEGKERGGAERAIPQTALMRLNRRVPNGTHGGVRGRLLN